MGWLDLFTANDLWAWIARLVLLFLALVIVYVYFPGLLKLKSRPKRISPKLRERENILLKRLEKLKKEEDALNAKKEAITRQIDEIIMQGTELRKMAGVKEKPLFNFKKTETPKKEKPAEKGKDGDIRRVMEVIDSLLGKLPETEINKFSKSKDFKLYKKVLERHGIK
jgi:hypothetical protein